MTNKTEDDLKNLVSELKSEVGTLRKRQTSMAQEISAIKKMTKYGELDSRLKSISSRMLALTIKDAVMTEVAYTHPDLAARLYEYRDMPDEFWIAHDKWTIDRWARAIRANYLQEAA